jgi:hypothetical protein
MAQDVAVSVAPAALGPRERARGLFHPGRQHPQRDAPGYGNGDASAFPPLLQNAPPGLP